jgi:hypothetical protein
MGTGGEPGRRSSDELAMFDDLNRIQYALMGHCFSHLQAWQRLFARWMLVMAARTISSAHCSHSTAWTDVKAPDDRKQPEQMGVGASLRQMIERSYEHDIASQKARIALRPDVPEADDQYFADDGEEIATELLPALVRFRERAAFKLQSV